MFGAPLQPACRAVARRHLSTLVCTDTSCVILNIIVFVVLLHLHVRQSPTLKSERHIPLNHIQLSRGSNDALRPMDIGKLQRNGKEEDEEARDEDE